jgi:hypothetical protein
MSNRADKFLSDYLELHRETRERTVAALGDDAFAFAEFAHDALDLQLAVIDCYPEEWLTNSLVGAFLPLLLKDLNGLQPDFLHARYPEIGRTLRHLWEQVFRGLYVDRYAEVHPDAADPPGPTVDDKLDWLEAHEAGMNWQTVIVPGLHHVLPGWTAGEIGAHFHTVWRRLNRVVHPSAGLVRSGFGDCPRHLFNHFDDGLARQLLADARAVLTVIWCAVMARFPKVIPRLPRDGPLFRQCPAARVWLDAAAAP